MAFVRIDPAGKFEKMSRRLNEFMSDFEKGVSFEIGGFTPRVDITEDDSNVFVHAELPGMDKDDIKISVNEENVLTIKGEKKKDSDSDKKSYIRSERVFGNFSRNFMLPDYINVDNISAKFTNGILELALPKKEPEKPKEVNIEIN
jgi:HSP20 family protein